MVARAYVSFDMSRVFDSDLAHNTAVQPCPFVNSSVLPSCVTVQRSAILRNIVTLRTFIRSLDSSVFLGLTMTRPLVGGNGDTALVAINSGTDTFGHFLMRIVLTTTNVIV